MAEKNRRLSIILIICGAVLIIAMVLLICLLGMNGTDSSQTKVGLILTGPREESGWNGAHYSGALSACSEYGAQLIVKENIPENTVECSEAVKELIADGASVIFLSSFNYAKDAENEIRLHPEIHFFCTAKDLETENLSSYFARMYQARYISGIIAAIQSETQSLGYVAAERNSEVIRGIDAFALGARSVDETVSINVIFTNEWDNKEKECAAVDRLVGELNADVIAYHQNNPYAALEADKLGVYSIGYHEAAEGISDKCLTSIVWDWMVIYREMMRDYYRDKDNNSSLYWLGMDTGAVKLTEFSPKVSPDAAAAAASAENEIKSGKDVFSGLIYDNNGNIRCNEDEAIGDDILFSEIDWFVQGVNVYE